MDLSNFCDSFTLNTRCDYVIPYFSNNKNYFHIVIMLKIGETKATKEKFSSTKKIIKFEMLVLIIIYFKIS